MMIGIPLRPCWSHLAWIVACVGESPSWLFVPCLCGDGSGTFESYSGSSCKIRSVQLSQSQLHERVTRVKLRVGFVKRQLELLPFKNAQRPSIVSSTTGLLSFATIVIAGELNGFITWWSAAEG